MLKIHPEANKDVHFEFESREAGAEPKELEIYIGGWFVGSVLIADITPEAKEYIFDSDIVEYKGSDGTEKTMAG